MEPPPGATTTTTADLDILLTGAYDDGTWHDVTKVYRNDGWAFHEVQTGLPQIAGAASWVDFDNDRDLDILLAGDTGDSARATEIWRNDDCTDLAVSKWANTTSIAPGQAITYTVVYTNNGPGPTHGVILTDIVSPVLHGVSYSSSGALITPTGAANYVWEVADLDAGEGGTITLTGVIDPDVPGCWGVSNEAEIYSYLDTNPTNNRAEVWAGTPLNTVAVNPTRNETAIDLTTDIQATLDTPVAADTVSGRTFAAQGMMGGLLTGTYDVEGGVVTLDPDRSLFPNEVVRTTLSSGLECAGGGRLVPTQWQFTAGPAISRCFAGFTQTGTGLPGARLGDRRMGRLRRRRPSGHPAGGAYRRRQEHQPGVPQRGRRHVRGHRSRPPGVRPRPEKSADTFPSWAGWGDYDNDGDLDIGLNAYDDNASTWLWIGGVWRNDGGTFTYADNRQVRGAMIATSGAWGDYDNDGDLDIVLSGGSWGTYTLIERNEDGVFVEGLEGLVLRRCGHLRVRCLGGLRQ